MLKVFESFSGVGAQHMALRNLKEKYEVVATSDIDINATLAYYFVHGNAKKTKRKLSTDEKQQILIKRGIITKSRLKNISTEQLDVLFDAVDVCNNLGDITKIDIKDIPTHDLFTYSFPCQDISSVGTKKGLDKNSGTRSSLLWECQRIIETKKPKYLLLENVKNLTTGKNRKNFDDWLKYLESIGYENYWKIFDSQYYGIPQRRPRVIVVSKLGKSKTNLTKDNEIKEKDIVDIIDINEKGWTKFKPKAEVRGDIGNSKYAFLDDRDWKINGVMISNVCSTQRAGRAGLKVLKNEKGVFYERKLNALECCRLMGYLDEDYINMHNGGLSDGQIMKICGNSIVVSVLENVFMNIYEEEKND